MIVDKYDFASRSLQFERDFAARQKLADLNTPGPTHSKPCNYVSCVD